MNIEGTVELANKLRAELKADRYSSSISVLPDAQDIFLWLDGESKCVLEDRLFSAMLHVVPDYITYCRTEACTIRNFLIGMDFLDLNITLEYITQNTKLTGCSGRLGGLHNMLSLLTVDERRNLPVKIIPASVYTPDNKTGRFFITHKEIIFPLRIVTASSLQPNEQENQNAKI